MIISRGYMAQTKVISKLSNREFAFADAILRGLSNIDAVREAGYSNSSIQTMRCQAARLMEKPAIKEYIELELRLKAEARRREVEVDDIWVTQQFKEIYNRCMQRIPVMRFDREAGQMVQETNENGEGVWTFDSSGANRALENLAKHIGYYEADNQQRRPIIKIGAVQNVVNFFLEDEDKENTIELPAT